jgi:hypothetical protein
VEFKVKYKNIHTGVVVTFEGRKEIVKGYPLNFFKYPDGSTGSLNDEYFDKLWVKVSD